MVAAALTRAVTAAARFGFAPRAGDERHEIVISAGANLHCHAFQRALAGPAEKRGARPGTVLGQLEG